MEETLAYVFTSVDTFVDKNVINFVFNICADVL